MIPRLSTPVAILPSTPIQRAYPRSFYHLQHSTIPSHPLPSPRRHPPLTRNPQPPITATSADSHPATTSRSPYNSPQRPFPHAQARIETHRNTTYRQHDTRRHWARRLGEAERGRASVSVRDGTCGKLGRG